MDGIKFTGPCSFAWLENSDERAGTLTLCALYLDQEDSGRGSIHYLTITEDELAAVAGPLASCRGLSL